MKATLITKFVEREMCKLYGAIEDNIFAVLAEEGYTGGPDEDEVADEMWYEAMQAILHIHKEYAIE